MTEQTTIDVRSAVKRAISYLQQFEDLIPSHDVRLEEVESNDGDWLITLSTAETAKDASGLAAVLGAGRRNYKRFQIDGMTGEMKSMKVRTLSPIE